MTIQELTISNGYAEDTYGSSAQQGGAIYVGEGCFLTLQRATVTSSSVPNEAGAGIFGGAGAQLVFFNVIFTGNTGASLGGAIFLSENGAKVRDGCSHALHLESFCSINLIVTCLPGQDL